MQMKVNTITNWFNGGVENENKNGNDRSCPARNRKKVVDARGTRQDAGDAIVTGRLITIGDETFLSQRR